MEQVFVSYSHRDSGAVERIAGDLRERGYHVWWDRHLAGGEDFSVSIESMLESSRCAVVSWSRAARNSLWVKAEANYALELGKLVQLTLDGSRPPLPFGVLHLVDFSASDAGPGQAPIDDLVQSIEAVGKVSHERPPVPARLAGRGWPTLAGFGPQVAVGGASLGVVAVAAGLVALASSGRMPANAFELGASAMFLAALLGFGYMLTHVIRTYLATHR